MSKALPPAAGGLEAREIGRTHRSPAEDGRLADVSRRQALRAASGTSLHAIDHHVFPSAAGLSASLLQGLKRRLGKMGLGAAHHERFLRYYGASANVRGMFQASFNNLPAASATGVKYALQSAGAGASSGEFEGHLKKGIKRAFSERGLPTRGVHHTTRTLNGARF